ncbi:MAG: tetratricopeptide repeat protein, partial [Cyanobacteriota bacterium]
EQLLAKLQQEPEFAQQVAQQLGLDTTDPNAIIEQVVQQITGGGQFAVKDPISWYNEGLKHATTGNVEAAIEAWDKTIALQPDFAEAWYNRGCALGQLKQPEEAIASYDKAVELKPDYIEAWFNRGTMLFQVGRFEEAIASYDQAIEINPDDASFWYHRANALNELERLQEALDSYNKAIAVSDVFPAAAKQRDEVQAKLNRLNAESHNEQE